MNFAISSRDHAIGVNHFGMQVDSTQELADLKALADDASNGATLDQGRVACCYAKSEKRWTVDPQGLAWEHFFTLAETEAFGEDTATQMEACCIPMHSLESAVKQGACCVPQESRPDQQQCCE